MMKIFFLTLATTIVFNAGAVTLDKEVSVGDNPFTPEVEVFSTFDADSNDDGVVSLKNLYPFSGFAIENYKQLNLSLFSKPGMRKSELTFHDFNCDASMRLCTFKEDTSGDVKKVDSAYTNDILKLFTSIGLVAQNNNYYFESVKCTALSVKNGCTTTSGCSQQRQNGKKSNSSGKSIKCQFIGDKNLLPIKATYTCGNPGDLSKLTTWTITLFNSQRKITYADPEQQVIVIGKVSKTTNGKWVKVSTSADIEYSTGYSLEISKNILNGDTNGSIKLNYNDMTTDAGEPFQYEISCVKQ